jgi:hypothetical protein
MNPAFKLSIALFLLISLPLPALAQLDVGSAVNFGRSPQGGGLSNLTFQQLIVNIGNWLLGLIVLLAMLALVVGGVMYVTSLGSEDGARRAKRVLLYAVIGFIVAILHGLIVLTLCEVLDVSCPVRAPLTWPELITNIGNLLLGLVAFLAMAAAVWGGVRYITALGDESQVAEAKRILLGAVIGIIYAGMHAVIVMAACQVAGASFPGCPSGNAAQEIGEVILSAVGILLALVASISVGAIAYAAYLYVTSTGEERRAAQAKQILLYVALGIAITMVSAIIVNVIINVLT